MFCGHIKLRRCSLVTLAGCCESLSVEEFRAVLQDAMDVSPVVVIDMAGVARMCPAFVRTVADVTAECGALAIRLILAAVPDHLRTEFAPPGYVVETSAIAAIGNL